jgi:hypothetical protein
VGVDAMSQQREAAVVLAMCAWAKKAISKIEDGAKAIADVSFPEEKTAGVVNDVVVSYTQRIQKRPELKILNPGAFTDWVAARWPDEIETTVRESFLNLTLRDIAVEHGALIDTQGEVCTHAELIDGTTYTMTRLTKESDVLAPMLEKLSLAELPGFIGGAE